MPFSMQIMAFWDHVRVDWSHHLEKLQHEGCFAAKYQMPERAFNSLVEILGPILQDDITKARNRCSKEINLKSFVAIVLCYIAGGLYDDIERFMESVCLVSTIVETNF
jgi:hypothetical protein